MHGMAEQAIVGGGGWAGQAAAHTLAAVTPAGEYVRRRILKVFREAHRDVQLRMEVGNRATVVERITAREADLGFGGRPPEGRGIRGVPFLDNELIVVAPPDHAYGDEDSVDPAVLATETWLVREPGSGTRETTQEFWAQNGFQVSSAMTLGSNGAVKQAAAAGLGVALISAHAVTAELASGSLCRLRGAGTPLRRSRDVVSPGGAP